MGERTDSRDPRRRNQNIEKRNPDMKKKRKEKKSKVKKVLLTLLTILVVVLVIGAGYITGFLKDISSGNLPEANKVSIDETINILLVGLDIGDVEHSSEESIKRTDTMMVINYNPDTKRVHLVSIPRDTLIKHNNKNAKLNAAYALGGEGFLIEKVEEILEVKMNYFVKVDYEAFIAIVDALGGVEMYIERDMNYDDDAQDLHIHFNKGETVMLDGKGAEEFFRWRQNNDRTGFADGDIGRIKNQQLLMKKIIEKCMSPSIITKVPKIVEAISNNVETNFDVKGMLTYALEFIKVNPDNIIMTTIQGNFKTIAKQSYVIYDKSLNTEILEALKKGKSSLSSIDKESVKIEVFNGTKVNGLAGDLKFKLSEAGYGSVVTGNSESPAKESVIYTNSEILADMLKEDSSVKKVEKMPKDKYEGFEAVIIIGDDYNIYGG